MRDRVVSVTRYWLLPASLALAVLGVLILSLTIPARAVEAVTAAVPPDPFTDWIIAVGYTGTVSLVDAETDIVYGPFLTGTLGSKSGGLFDVAVVPGSNLALISNFGDSAVYFVDFSDRMSPTMVASVTIPMFAEDIAVDRNGRYAYVSDGSSTSRLAVIDIRSASLAYSPTLGAASAQAVDIAPDGTVVTVNYFGGGIHSLYPDASGQLTVTGTYTYYFTPEGQIVWPDELTGMAHLAAPVSAAPSSGVMGPSTEGVQSIAAADALTVTLTRPVNVAIAPDGQTVVVADTAYYTQTDSAGYGQKYAVAIFQITAPGVLSYTGVITDLDAATQSIAFSEDGTKAYLSQNGGGLDSYTRYAKVSRLTVLDIAAPGIVTLDRANAVDFTRYASSQLFGVDTIAVARGKAYLGNPTVSGAGTDLRVIHLDDYSVKELEMPGIISGVGVLSPIQVYVPAVYRSGQ